MFLVLRLMTKTLNSFKTFVEIKKKLRFITTNFDHKQTNSETRVMAVALSSKTKLE